MPNKAGIPTKKEKRLQSRRQAFDIEMKVGSKENKVQTRMDTGGFRKPGSMNK